MQEICPFCQTMIPPGSYFCPNCGKALREKPLSATLMKQLSIYALSVFLPPLGLWPGIKYLKQEDSKLKTIGAIAIILTVLSTVISIILYLQIMKSINQAISSQMGGYQQLP